jgi:hypothetical protein
MVQTHVGASVGVAVGMNVGDPVVPAAEAARSPYPVVDRLGNPLNRVRPKCAARVPPPHTPFAPAVAEPTLQRFCGGDLRMLKGYSSEIAGVLKGYSRGTRGVLNGYSRAPDLAIGSARASALPTAVVSDTQWARASLRLHVVLMKP